VALGVRSVPAIALLWLILAEEIDIYPDSERGGGRVSERQRETAVKMRVSCQFLSGGGFARRRAFFWFLRRGGARGLRQKHRGIFVRGPFFFAVSK